MYNSTVKEQLLGIALLIVISATIFTRWLDILFCAACVYVLIHMAAELGVWMGVLYRKEDD